MWLVPATLADAPLLFEWARHEGKWLETVLPEAARWRSDKRKLKRSLNKRSKWGVMIASERGPAPDAGRWMVGLLAIDHHSELRWGVCPGYDPQAVATKMLKMLVGPGLSVMVDRGDPEAAKVLTAAGFNLLADGDLQSWRAKGVGA